MKFAQYIYGRGTHGRRYTYRCHPRKVGSIGLLLNLFKSRFVHGAYKDQDVRSFEFISKHLQFV